MTRIHLTRWCWCLPALVLASCNPEAQQSAVDDASKALPALKAAQSLSKHYVEVVFDGAVGTEAEDTSRYQITGPNAWQMPREQGNTPDPYVNEHTHLIASIRAGKPINELKNVAESTLTAIMGRMSAYTGKVVTWDQALNSTEELVPVALDWKANMEIPAIAIPGQTELK